MPEKANTPRCCISCSPGPARERGAALIIVLGTVAVLTLLVLHITAASEITARETEAEVERALLRYAAESGAEHAWWMLLADRRRFPGRSFPGPGAAGHSDVERWRADGVERNLERDGFLLAIVIDDADSGIGISGNRPLACLFGEESAAAQDSFSALRTAERLTDLLNDYVDSNDGDAARLSGMERPGYRRLGQPALPRNGPLQYRDELLWISGVAEFAAELDTEITAQQFLSLFRTVPPAGRSYPGVSHPSFLSSTPLLIRRMSGLGAEEISEAKAYFSGRANDGVRWPPAPDIQSRLAEHFSFVESGIVSITVTARRPGGTVQRVVKFSRDARTVGRTAGDMQVVENWEKLFP